MVFETKLITDLRRGYASIREDNATLGDENAVKEYVQLEVFAELRKIDSRLENFGLPSANSSFMKLVIRSIQEKYIFSHCEMRLSQEKFL